VPSAGAAAGASAAGGAGASAGAGALSVVAGGAAAVSGLAASCFAQAVSISAATSALRASLVFIDRYPKEKQEWYENDTNELRRSASPIRIAAANSIESPVDLKQPDELSVVYDIGRRLFVLTVQRTTPRRKRPVRQDPRPVGQERVRWEQVRQDPRPLRQAESSDGNMASGACPASLGLSCPAGVR
jgi:hypothetical protein